jgi:hypothetical protein
VASTVRNPVICNSSYYLKIEGGATVIDGLGLKKEMR